MGGAGRGGGARRRPPGSKGSAARAGLRERQRAQSPAAAIITLTLLFLLLARAMVATEGLREMEGSALRRLVCRDEAGAGRCLLLDCRPFLAHSAGHIRGALNVRCNTIVRRRAKGAVSLEQILPAEGEVRARLRAGLYAAVVVYDERSPRAEALREDSTVALVVRALRRDTARADIRLLAGTAGRGRGKEGNGTGQGQDRGGGRGGPAAGLWPRRAPSRSAPARLPRQKLGAGGGCLRVCVRRGVRCVLGVRTQRGCAAVAPRAVSRDGRQRRHPPRAWAARERRGLRHRRPSERRGSPCLCLRARAQAASRPRRKGGDPPLFVRVHPQPPRRRGGVWAGPSTWWCPAGVPPAGGRAPQAASAFLLRLQQRSGLSPRHGLHLGMC